MSSPTRRPGILALRFFVLATWGPLGAAAALWAWMMPHGFALAHPRAWSNTILPLGTAVLGALAVVAAVRPWPRLAAALAAFPGALLAAMAVAGRLAFPSSLALAWLLPFSAGLVAMALALALAAWAGKLRGCVAAGSALAALLAAWTGALGTLAQRAPGPSTRPLGASMPVVAPGSAPPAPFLAQGVVGFDPDAGLVRCLDGDASLEVEPRLLFESRSPDGCWSLLSRGRSPRIPLHVEGRDASGWRVAYRGLGEHVLDVRPGEGAAAGGAAPGSSDTVRIEVHARLAERVFSHLNSWTQLTVRGLRRPAVSFSPCPEVIVEPATTASPWCFASLFGDGRFRVVRARAAEKGPFRELGTGPLPRDGALALTIWDGDQPRWDVVFDDFAAQASTEPSPTAGWGVPQNAIEMRIAHWLPGEPALISITLAGTGVGRGWDTVGHAAGAYRNRMRVVARRG